MSPKKVILITGAAFGIGKATALLCAEQGLSVVIADISEQGEASRDLILKSGGKAVYFRCDVTHAIAHQQLLLEIHKKFGRLDYTFNNAGIEQQPAKMADIEEEQWDKVLSVNLKGVWLGMKSQLRYMLKQGHGVIVNTASVAALKAVEQIGIYNAAKAGVVLLTKTAAREYAKHNIRVNAICPGLIMTEMAERMAQTHPSYFQENMLNVIPMGRGGTPDEMARLVLWLCREATFITGQCITADGGWLA